MAIEKSTRGIKKPSSEKRQKLPRATKCSGKHRGCSNCVYVKKYKGLYKETKEENEFLILALQIAASKNGDEKKYIENFPDLLKIYEGEKELSFLANLVVDGFCTKSCGKCYCDQC